MRMLCPQGSSWSCCVTRWSGCASVSNLLYLFIRICFRKDNKSNLNCYQVEVLRSLVRNHAYPYLDVELFKGVGVVYYYLGL